MTHKNASYTFLKPYIRLTPHKIHNESLNILYLFLFIQSNQFPSLIKPNTIISKNVFPLSPAPIPVYKFKICP